ncbi:MAG: DUF2330 domain-containing protein [candidate division WOR-3 bacterium]|nr:DUF2330 domain-containing protein [candidate division WOR-3 bacterium]
MNPIRIRFALSHLLLAITLINADKGMIPLARPDIDLYNSAQRAIIIWNGKEEIIILSTNVSSSETTKVLEILPLPSKPQVSQGDFEIFYRINQMIYEKSRHLLPAYIQSRKGADLELKSTLKILFQKQIGVHFLTCVQALNYEELLKWIKQFLQDQNLPEIQIPKKLPEIIKNYFDSKIFYFVFDIIEIKPQEASITPIIYKFKSDALYYPLVISALSEGKTEIQLYTITPGIPDIWDVPLPLQYAYYEIDGEKIRPICFPLEKKELQFLFSDKNYLRPIKNPYLSVFHFYGYLSQLHKDLRVKRLLNHFKY